MPKTGRFYLSQDDSGDKYIIPWNKRTHWENFVDSFGDEVPEYAVLLDGGVLTFCSWEIKR